MTQFKRQYTYNHKDNTGYAPCDILVQYYESEEFRGVILRKDDFEELAPWKLCTLLQAAYDAGRDDAMRDLRIMIGVK